MNQSWAELLIGSLAHAGAEHFVVSPGSRSTPLVLAMARLGVPVTVIVDERAAAFYALGRARVTGLPSVLVCTSGTAGAHYLPAIIEADSAQVPLIAVTADRPPELHQCSAPQTIDQQHLFGRAVRAFVDVGLPDDHPAALDGLVRKARQLVATSRGPVPGPVHINVPARKPLEPAAEPSEAERALSRRVDALLAEPPAPPVSSHLAVPDRALADVAELLARARRPLIVAGPASLCDGDRQTALAALANRARVPLLAEVTSGLRLSQPRPAGLIDHFDLLLKSDRFTGETAPDLIIQIGRAPVSRSWNSYVQGPARAAQLIVLANETWSDSTGRAQVMTGNVTDLCGRLDEMVEAGAGTGSWLDHWQRADGRARAVIDRLLAEETAQMSEAIACTRAIAAVPTGGVVVVGNSLPIRTIELCRAIDERSIDVLSQRGAAGIDGLIASAAGTASASGRPTMLLIGDVSFAHDLASLAVARTASAPLAICVIDNGGGRIFEQLPIAHSTGAAELMDRFFVTAPAIDFESAARTYGVACCPADVPAAIDSAVATALARPGPMIIPIATSAHGAIDFDRQAAGALEAQS